MADFNEIDKPRQLTQAEIRAADDEAKRKKINYGQQSDVHSQGGVIVTNSQRRVKVFGTTGNNANQISGSYLVRISADGGTLESRKCLNASLNKLMG